VENKTLLDFQHPVECQLARWTSFRR